MNTRATEEDKRAWEAGAPYTPVMENMGYKDRVALKSLRGKARAKDLELVVVHAGDGGP